MKTRPSFSCCPSHTFSVLSHHFLFTFLLFFSISSLLSLSLSPPLPLSSLLSPLSSLLPPSLPPPSSPHSHTAVVMVHPPANRVKSRGPLMPWPRLFVSMMTLTRSCISLRKHYRSIVKKRKKKKKKNKQPFYFYFIPF